MKKNINLFESNLLRRKYLMIYLSVMKLQLNMD